MPYEPRPYVRPMYEPDTRTLHELLRMAGEARARHAGQRGQNTAQGLFTLGQILSQGLGGIRQDREQRQLMEAAAAKQQQEDAFKRRDQQLREADLLARIEERAQARQDKQEADAYKRGTDIAERGPGPLLESQIHDAMAGPGASQVRYVFGPGTADGPELKPTPQQQQAMRDRENLQAQGYSFGPDGKPIAPLKPERPPQPTTASLAALAAAGDKNAQKALEILQRTRGTSSQASPEIPTIDAPADPDSQDIMSQAGLSYNAFQALTGRMGQLPRDRVTRERASQEVQQWARNRGVDVATFASQYKAANAVLETQIKRFNNVKVAEAEIAGDVANLTEAAKESGLNDVRAVNAAKLWLKGELNDPAAATYAMHLNQLRNDLAMYNAASQGRTGNVFVQDMQEAEQVIQRGIAAGSLKGLETALTRSVDRMGSILEDSLNRARKDVWSLFGVGDKYKPVSRSRGNNTGKVRMQAPDGSEQEVDAAMVEHYTKLGARVIK